MTINQNLKSKMDNDRTHNNKIFNIVLKIGASFIILEPIWMLLPFAGFLYGSVMHIEFLNRTPYTAWLVNFVLPTHSLFPLGLILVFLGFSVFLYGAYQVYTAKFLKKGLVKTGIYKKFRHPQYLALTLFGIGILLTWGRFITYIAFFMMLWLYYYLSKSEENKCLQLFGEEYANYRSTTYFLFPGEQLIVRLTKKLPSLNFPGWTIAVLSFVIITGISIVSGSMIQKVKTDMRNTIPVKIGQYYLSDDISKSINLIMVKGPVLQASPSNKMREQFMDKYFEMLVSSKDIRETLGQYNIDNSHSLIVFLTPGSNWYGEKIEYETSKVNVFIYIIKTPINYTNNNFKEFRKNWQLLKLVIVRDMSYENTKMEEDRNKYEIETKGPPFGMIADKFQERMEKRIDFFLSGL